MSEWIKCSDRLPDIHQCVIAYTDDDHEFAYFGGSIWVEWYSGEQINVTHWMNLPEPPK